MTPGGGPWYGGVTVLEVPVKDIVEVDQHDIFDKYPALLGLMEVDAEYDFDNCVTRASRDQPYEEIDVAAALIVTRGNISACGRLLGRSRRSVDGFITRNDMLLELRDEITAIQLDAIESKAMAMALAGDGSLVKFLLSTKGKGRGYVQRVENTGKDGAPLNNITTYELPDNGRDTRVMINDNVVSIRQTSFEEGDEG